MNVFPGGTSGEELACQFRRLESWFRSLGQEDPLEQGMVIISSILAWRIPWTEEPGGLQSIGSQSPTTEATNVYFVLSYYL